MRRRMWAVLSILALIGLVAGCSSGSDGGAVRDASGGGGAGADLDAEATGGDAGEEAGGGDLGAQAAPSDDPARIIYTSDLRVRVDEPARAAEAAIDLVEADGGSLASQSEVDGEDQVSVTMRVPVGGFRSALEALAGLGTVLDRRVDAQDVTDQVVDLEGRLENARASADRLRELYTTAADVEQVVAIEQALTEREAEVESLAGQLQQLEDQADRSTITVTFVDEGEPVAEDDDDANAFVKGMRAAGDVISALGTIIAALAGFAVPFLPLLLVLGAVGWAVTVPSRRRRRRAASDAEAGPFANPGPIAADAPGPDAPAPPASAAPTAPPTDAPEADRTGWGAPGAPGQDGEPPTPPS